MATLEGEFCWDNDNTCICGNECEPEPWQCHCICHTLGTNSEMVCTHCKCKKPQPSIIQLGKSLGWFNG